MLFLISPAKTLDFETSSLNDEFTQPVFQKEAAALITIMRSYSWEDLARIMGLSEKLARLNVERYHAWQLPFNLQNAKQAIFAFKGDVYAGLSVETMDEQGLSYLQNNLRILSGLYGLLKPLDLMQAYRLEMGTKLLGTKLSHKKCEDLYRFWDDKITKAINDELDNDHDFLINLASNEYFKAVKPGLLSKKIITPVFKDEKNGQFKIISFYAKKARGLMARFAADHQVQAVQDLKNFDYEGYRFAADESSEFTWVFKRSAQQ